MRKSVSVTVTPGLECISNCNIGVLAAVTPDLECTSSCNTNFCVTATVTRFTQQIICYHLTYKDATQCGWSS